MDERASMAIRATVLAMVALLISGGASALGPENRPPTIGVVIGAPDADFVNPLNASAEATDPDGDAVRFVWMLDGQTISEDENVTYHVLPGYRNLTLVVDDNNGSRAYRYWEFVSPEPPGWNDIPDNDGNRLMFWLLLGIPGSLLAITIGIILFRPLRKGKGKDGRNDGPR